MDIYCSQHTINHVLDIFEEKHYMTQNDFFDMRSRYVCLYILDVLLENGYKHTKLDYFEENHRYYYYLYDCHRFCKKDIADVVKRLKMVKGDSC